MNDQISTQMAEAIKLDEQGRPVKSVTVQTAEVVGQPVDEKSEPVII